MVEARLFQALSDATRLKILALLAREPMNVSRMVTELGHTQPAVSRHLRVLREVDLIHDTRRGKEVEYSLNHGRLSDAAAYLEQLVGVVPGEVGGGSDWDVKGRRHGSGDATGTPAPKPGAKAGSEQRAEIKRRNEKAVGHGGPTPQKGQRRAERRDEPEYAIERKDDTMDDFLL
jgi:DNA-binding transcriptional ArsR family regulator